MEETIAFLAEPIFKMGSLNLFSMEPPLLWNLKFWDLDHPQFRHSFWDFLFFYVKYLVLSLFFSQESNWRDKRLKITTYWAHAQHQIVYNKNSFLKIITNCGILTEHFLRLQKMLVSLFKYMNSSEQVTIKV